jgi:hypothetical protein
MSAMHLPDPTMFGSRGRPGVSLESILDPPTLETYVTHHPYGRIFLTLLVTNKAYDCHQLSTCKILPLTIAPLALQCPGHRLLHLRPLSVLIRCTSRPQAHPQHCFAMA